MIREAIWRGIAKLVSHPRVANWLIERSKRTPYTPIYGRQSDDLFMERWWLFNPYPPLNDGRKRKWGDWIPSVRIHHIVRPDDDRHLHDHPWNARTIILRGWYLEELPYTPEPGVLTGSTEYLRDFRTRRVGDTGRLLFGQYHRIAVVGQGTYTLFITWRYQGTWGFNVDGVKVPWRTYLGVEEKQ